MKIIISIILCVFSTLSFADVASIQDPNRKWVGVMWGYKDQDPIISPMLYNTEKECLDEVKKFNEIAKSTVKIDRKYKCRPVYKTN